MRVLLPTTRQQVQSQQKNKSQQSQQGPTSSERLDSPTPGAKGTKATSSSSLQPEAATITTTSNTTTTNTTSSTSTGHSSSSLASSGTVRFESHFQEGDSRQRRNVVPASAGQGLDTRSSVSRDDCTTANTTKLTIGTTSEVGTRRTSTSDTDRDRDYLNSRHRSDLHCNTTSERRSGDRGLVDTTGIVGETTAGLLHQSPHPQRPFREAVASLSKTLKDRKRRSSSPSSSSSSGIGHSSASSHIASTGSDHKIRKIDNIDSTDCKQSARLHQVDVSPSSSSSSSSSSSLSMGYKASEKKQFDDNCTSKTSNTNDVITSAYTSRQQQWQNILITSNDNDNPAEDASNDSDPAEEIEYLTTTTPTQPSTTHETKHDRKQHHRPIANSLRSTTASMDKSTGGSKGIQSTSSSSHGTSITTTAASSSATTTTRTTSRLKEDIMDETKEEADFKASLKNKGLEMMVQAGDGNCLFRAVSLQIYGDPEVHMEVRKSCIDFMAKDREHFVHFIEDETFDDYIKRKRCFGVHGNNPEIQAISELYNRPVEVYVPQNGAEPINIFHAEYKTCDVPIRLSYHDGNHYNAVVDPNLPTAGLGLGLPGLEVGLADKLQLQKAVDESDKVAQESHEKEVNQAILESKKAAVASSSQPYDFMLKQKALALSDMEATDIELEQAALLSSLETYQQTEVGKKQPWNHQKDRRQRQQPQQQQQQQQQQQVQYSHEPQESYSTSSSAFASLSSQTNTASRNHEASYSTTSQSSSSSSNVASLSSAGVTSSAFASASATTNYNDDSIPQHLLQDDEYPQCVQELTMNGFELQKVVKAYELIGDNFDDMLAYLMNSVG